MNTLPEPTVTLDLNGIAATLPKKAATVLTNDQVIELSRLTAARLMTLGAPSWNPEIVVSCHEEILSDCEALGTPLELPLVDCFIKASHMVHWYNNTIAIWSDSLIGGDFGEKYVESGCALKTCLSSRTSSRILGYWTALAQFGQLEAYLKWVTANFFAAELLQEELPPVPSQFQKLVSRISTLRRPYPGTGWSHLFCRRQPASKRVKEGRKWRFTFAKDFYMTKNASLPVDKSFVEKSLIKHQTILCGEPNDLLSDDTYDEVCEAIQLCADEIFGKIRSTEDYYYEDSKNERGEYIIHQTSLAAAPSRLPSFGASYHGQRGEGGACGEILRNYHDVGSLPEPAEGYLWGYASKQGHHRCEVRTYHDPTLYLEAESLACRLAYSQSSEGVLAHVVPLVEPFKVRTITKGSAEIYHLARRWQKVIHNRMRQHPAFSLIGQPCNGAFLSQTFGNKELFDYGHKGFFVSGDYESATDLLNPALSEYAQEQISLRLKIPIEDQYVLKQCLTGHQLSYEKDGPAFPQAWGQLMGSPTSFPVLCLVNMAATLVSYNRRLERSHHLSDLPICVNGDDVLFWAKDRKHYQIWKQITGECGLKFSLGKNYTSRECCVINSELYYFIRPGDSAISRPSLLFRQAPALNSRLLCGGSRSSATTGFDPLALSDKDIPIYSKALEGLGIDLAKHFGVEAGDRPQNSVKAEILVKKMRKHYRDDDFAEDYAKWYNTIPSRVEGLIKQLNGEIEGDQVRPKMRERAMQVFNDLQVSRLHKFACVEGRLLTTGRPRFYMPQALGGLGLIPPSNYQPTVTDHLAALTLKNQPAAAHSWVTSITPKMASVSFMESVRAEIREIQDTLEIQQEFVSAADIEMLRFNGEETQFWDHEFLVGFVNAENVVVDEESRTRKAGDLNNILSKTYWFHGDLSKEMARQTRRLIKEKKLRAEQRSLDHRGKFVWTGTVEGATGFTKDLDYLVSRRPMPRFE